MNKSKSRSYANPYFLFVCIAVTLVLISGCSHLDTELQDANALFTRGDYQASLSRYERITADYPASKDRVLFEMGLIYSYSGNDQKDYGKSLECFQKLVKDYPASAYRKDGEMMIFNITNITTKDRTIAEQQARIETLRGEVSEKGSSIASMRERMEALQREIESKEDELTSLQEEIAVLRGGPADRILIEKKEHRLMLLSQGKVIKTYRIALGGDPNGPKVRQGDNKTPEGTYVIDYRNTDSRYHLSLHISYPNDKDRKRARELGVSPGGDIMIHGLKKGFGWLGRDHSRVDWTKGCIAVTDKEIEEIAKLAPIGTVVEIRP